MAKKTFLWGMLALALAFGMMVVGCGEEPKPSPKPPQPGETVDNPIDRIADTNLGTMTSSASGWQELLDSIKNEGKYVNLDLSACTMTGTSFNPDATVETGKDYIVSIILPTAATSIEEGSRDDSTFQGFINLESIKGANITTIGAYSFHRIGGGKKLQQVDFPKATTIGESAFIGTDLETANFPLVTTIGKNAFYGGDCLKNVSFPIAQSIGEYAFYSCSNLENISFPNVTTIGGNAFSYCINLASLNIPKVTSIRTSAFGTSGNTALSITMGSVAPTLGWGIFYNTDIDISGRITNKTVTVKVPSGATGYSPFTGTPVTVSGADNTENWANGFRGGGWNGSTWESDTSKINQNISLVIQQQ